MKTGSNKKIYVAFLWHMHQPYYKSLIDNEHKMPWVRLHALKDYLDMPLMLEEYPKIKANFNLVPSLLEQIQDFADGKAEEEILRLTRKEAKSLTDKEKILMLKKLFRANYDTMIKPHERYHELFQRRGWAKTEEEITKVMPFFFEQDFLDLQALFTLSWIDPFRTGFQYPLLLLAVQHIRSSHSA